MKKRIISIFACSLLLLGGGLFVRESLRSSKVEQARATDIGEITFESIHDASNAYQIYFRATQKYESMPQNWTDADAYHLVGGNGGVFLNGTDLGNVSLKKVPEIESGYYWFIQLPSSASVGDVLEIKGFWSGSTSGGDFSFTIADFYRQFTNGTPKWDYALSDYDVVSLADCQLPDYPNGAINTLEPGDYTTDKVALPKKTSYFGLTNETQSFAFQFYFEADGTMTNWLDIRFGSNTVYNGHLMRLQMTNIWGAGTVIMKEEVDGAVYDGHTHEIGPDISTGQRLIEFGVVKVLGAGTKHFVYFKNNNVVAWSTYWDLDPTPFTGKVAIYAPDTNIAVTNSVALSPAAKLSINPYDSTSSVLYLTAPSDILPIVHNWDDYFVPVTDDGIQLNETAVGGTNHWNYFKKISATSYCFDVGKLVTSPAAGDIVRLGGLFKAAHIVDSEGYPNILTMYKFMLADSYFEFDGEKWVDVDANYTAVDFSKDLLKQTLAICTGAGGNNKDALTPVWATLAGANYYGKLTSARKVELTIAEAADVTVPATESGIDGMTDENALAAAMYRYEYCVAKYNLNQFIVGKTVVVQGTGVDMFAQNNVSNITILVIVITSISLLAVAGLCFYKKKEI